MVGNRVYNKSPHLFENGEYGKWTSGVGLPDCFYANCPNGAPATLVAHQVIEHEDGTITVSPSIEVNRPGRYHNPVQPYWHGFLERGIWRSC